ncbi:hypothetical protein AB0L85_07930 [Streptomyces sp. NPDC052051]|uniref:hypothetical protein n=1 Tax=Streptomyces sp. NPDC052051 TaxID=3154649 RepID=UPI00342DE255
MDDKEAAALPRGRRPDTAPGRESPHEPSTPGSSVDTTGMDSADGTARSAVFGEQSV